MLTLFHKVIPSRHKMHKMGARSELISDLEWLTVM